MMPEQIVAVKDVEAFFRHIFFDRKVDFHPDDDFSVFENQTTGEPTFLPEEAEKYNAMMDDCFQVCEKFHVDIYDKWMKALIAD